MFLITSPQNFILKSICFVRALCVGSFFKIHSAGVLSPCKIVEPLIFGYPKSKISGCTHMISLVVSVAIVCIISDSALDKAWMPLFFLADQDIGEFPKKITYPPMLLRVISQFSKSASVKAFICGISSPPKISPKFLVPVR